jgi:hypothetical protein
MKDSIIYDEYTQDKIKKAYVSIRIRYESARSEEDENFGRYQIKSFDKKPFEELKKHNLKGILGVSTSNYNISEWLVHRECLVVMPFDKFKELNKTEQIKYYDADYLTKDGLEVFYRLYNRKERTDRDYYSILQNIFPKIHNEFTLEASVRSGSEYTNMYVVANWFNVYESSRFIEHASKQSAINSPEDLARIVINYIESGQAEKDYSYNKKTQNLTVESIISPISKGIVASGRVYADESEWLIKNVSLKIPKNSQLFFVLNDYDNMRDVYEQMISTYDLREGYKIAFISQRKLNEFQSKRFALKDERYKEEYKNARTSVEKNIVKSLRQIQSDVIKSWADKITEVFKESNFNEDYKDVNDGTVFGNNILECPSVITYFDSLMLKFIDIYDSQIDSIVKTKNKYYILDIFNSFLNYLSNLKDEEGNDEIGVKTEWNFIHKGELLRILIHEIRDVSASSLGERVKSNVGSDMYRYFTKDEIAFKNGGNINFTYEIGGL